MWVAVSPCYLSDRNHTIPFCAFILVLIFEVRISSLRRSSSAGTYLVQGKTV